MNVEIMTDYRHLINENNCGLSESRTTTEIAGELIIFQIIPRRPNQAVRVLHLGKII